MKIRYLLACLFLCFYGQAQKKSRRDHVITMKTSMGSMKLVLFDETPMHKANFIKLVKDDFYDGLLFHRVIEDFMVQGGDPETRNAKPGTKLGSGGSGMGIIPFEFVSKHIHLKGALAAARTNNPEKKSSACQFYIVAGKKYSGGQMQKMAQQNKMKYTDAQLKAYTEIGGAPFLDNNYTVYGQVVQGLGVLDKIQSMETDEADRPKVDVVMKMKARKMRRKKIARKYPNVYLQ